MNLDDFLAEVAEHNATDLYLVAGAVPCINCAGQFMAVKASGMKRLTSETLEGFARYLMSDQQYENFQRTREANLAHMSDRGGRYRVNIFWQRGSIAIVMRRIISEIPTLRQLGLPTVLRDIALADRGIVLVTGATGSGKSTTMASMVDYRNHVRTGHIISIEDPVEFVYQHFRSIVTQREVGIDTMSFQEALKNSLRQAPQVISIGELRDAETVKFAMHAAETGHLVFATLHSTNGPLTVERVLNFYPGELKEQVQVQLSINLKAIVSQRLIPSARGGRVAAIEVLVNTPRMGDLIAKGDQSELKMAMNMENQDGICSFQKALYRLVKRNLITKDDALMAADSANDLELKFRGIGITAGSSWEDVSDPWANVRGDYDAPESFLRAKQGAAVRPPAQVQGSYSNDGIPRISPDMLKTPIPSASQSQHRMPAPQPPPARPPAPAPQGGAAHGAVPPEQFRQQQRTEQARGGRIFHTPPPEGLDELD